MILASAILRSFEFKGVLVDFVRSRSFRKLKILEINKAGSLNSVLKQHPGHRLITYPEFDMMNLGTEGNFYNLVVHSDTLEHVSEPVLGLSECRRVARQDGRCIYTVPMIVDRLTRSRDGLPESSHGSPDSMDRGMKVFYEFGADAWCFPVKAGFGTIKLHTVDYPAGVAIEARC